MATSTQGSALGIEAMFSQIMETLHKSVRRTLRPTSYSLTMYRQTATRDF